MTRIDNAWEAGKWYRSLLVGSVSVLLFTLLNLLRASWRISPAYRRRLHAILASGRPIVAVFWHGNYLPLFALFSGLPVLVVSSCSFRGAVIARVARRFGYRSVQTGKRSTAARTLILEELSRPDGLVTIAVDGPLGPRYVVKPGAIALAARRGAWIVPVYACTKPLLVLRHRWDRMQVPLPGSRIDVRIAAPIPVGNDDPTSVMQAADAVQMSLMALMQIPSPASAFDRKK